MGALVDVEEENERDLGGREQTLSALWRNNNAAISIIEPDYNRRALSLKSIYVGEAPEVINELFSSASPRVSDPRAPLSVSNDAVVTQLKLPNENRPREFGHSCISSKNYF